MAITRALQLVVASGYTESLSAPSGAIASSLGALLCNLVSSLVGLVRLGQSALNCRQKHREAGARRRGVRRSSAAPACWRLSNCTLRGFFPPTSPYARTSAYKAILRLQFNSSGARASQCGCDNASARVAFSSSERSSEQTGLQELINSSRAVFAAGHLREHERVAHCLRGLAQRQPASVQRAELER